MEIKHLDNSYKIPSNNALSPNFTGIKLREPTDKEREEIGLYWNVMYNKTHYDHHPAAHVFELTDEVWAGAVFDNTPTYRLYDLGTNCLIIAKYIPDEDKWIKINPYGITNLYGFLWKLIGMKREDSFRNVPGYEPKKDL